MLLGQQVIALDKSSLIEVISAATWPNKFVGATDNKGLAPTYLSLSYTCSYWKNAYYTHKCSFTRPYLPGLHILESLLAIDRPGIIQISLAWSSALTLDI